MAPSLRLSLAPTLGPQCDDLSSLVLRRVLDFSCSALVSCQHQINKYHDPVGDAIAEVATVILKDLESRDSKLECRHPAGVLYSLGLAVDEVMWPGKVGAALTVLLLRWAEHLEKGLHGGTVDAMAWANAAEEGFKCVEVTGWKGEVVVHGLGPVIGGFVRDIGGGMDWLEALEAAARRAEEGAKHTEKFHEGFADSACHALGVAVRAVYQAAKIETAAAVRAVYQAAKIETAAAVRAVYQAAKLETAANAETTASQCPGKAQIEDVTSISSSEDETDLKICNYESKDLKKKHEESQSKVSVPISIRSSKSDFLEGTRSDDNEEEKDSVLIHSEVREENDKDKHTTDTSDSVLIHSELSSFDSLDGTKHDSGIEVTDSVIIHSEEKPLESKSKSEQSDFIPKNYPKKRLSLYPALGEPAQKRPTLTKTLSTLLENSQNLVFPTPRKPLSFYNCDNLN